MKSSIISKQFTFNNIYYYFNKIITQKIKPTNVRKIFFKHHFVK